MIAGGRRIGQIEIHRVLEMVMPFDRRAFFPNTSDEAWAPHRSWLEPDALDPKSDALLFPMQSYIVRTAHHTVLIDSCVGNGKDRPKRPAWHLKSDDAYLRGLASSASARRHRLRVLYPLMRSCRLEHALENGAGFRPF